jgi:hypothetical protein
MAKRRGRGVSLDGLMAELRSLDTRRTEIVSSIQNALASVTGGMVSPAAGRRRGRPAGSTNKTKGTRKRRTMSDAARAKISAAQKKRWAKHKATPK